jgi:hypothetical protein
MLPTKVSPDETVCPGTVHSKTVHHPRLCATRRQSTGHATAGCGPLVRRSWTIFDFLGTRGDGATGGARALESLRRLKLKGSGKELEWLTLDGRIVICAAKDRLIIRDALL